MIYAMVDIYCASYARPLAAVTLDIDDTADFVHGHQQLSLFNAHCNERCFLPIHVYDTATSRPVAVLLRPGQTPPGDEVRRRSRRRSALRGDEPADSFAVRMNVIKKASVGCNAAWRCTIAPHRRKGCNAKRHYTLHSSVRSGNFCI